MAPRALPKSPIEHESVALISTISEATLESDDKPKRPSLFVEQIAARWLRIPAAVKYSGINRSRLFKIIAEGKIRTACLKEHPRAKRGMRLIDRFSLDRYLETLARPMEERLVEQADELQLQEQELAKQQQLLAQEQRAVEQQLAQIRGRQSKLD